MPLEYPDRPVVAVGVVVLYAGRVLLVERGQQPSRGLWAVPGGAVELGETLTEAAEREVREETAVTVRARAPVWSFDSVVRADDGRVRFHYVVVDVEADYVDGEPAAGDDAAAARWFTPDELARVDVSPYTADLLRRLGWTA